MEQLGGRKFVLTVLLVVAGVALVGLGKLSVADFKEFVLWGVGMFMGSNTLVHFAQRK